MGRHKKVGSACVHWWLIDAQNKGVCKKCGAHRDFQALLLKVRQSSAKALPGGRPRY